MVAFRCLAHKCREPPDKAQSSDSMPDEEAFYVYETSKRFIGLQVRLEIVMEQACKRVYEGSQTKRMNVRARKQKQETQNAL